MISTVVLPGSNLIDYVIPVPKSRNMGLLRDILLVTGFSIFLAFSAQAAISLPYLTPVPVTLQTLSVLLTGAALGSRRGALAVLAYLAEGAMGFPVFSGGIGGFIRLFGLTGGYLWAFPIAAYVTGWLCEKGLDRSVKTSMLAMLPGMLIIYGIGVSWLAFVLHINILTAVSKGMLPFLVGDAIKLIIAAALLPTTWRILRLKESKKNNRKNPQ